MEPVFLAQLMEHIVEVTEDSGNRKRKRKHRSRNTNADPPVRFSVSNMITCDGVAYDFDPGANKSVDVAAIRGRVESSTYTTISVLPGWRLEAFDIQQLGRNR
jgi:hypothetical protein